MKLSVFYAHVLEAEKQTGKPREEILKELKAAGIEGLEFSYEDLADPDSVKQMLKEAGMDVVSVYRFFSFEENSDPAPGRELVDMAVKMGSRMVMPIPGFYPEGCDRETVRGKMLEPMRALAAYAQERGLTITVEDFDSAASPIGTAEGMQWFADRIPGLFYTFDSGNFYYSGQDELEAFDSLKDKIRHVHCKDRALSTSLQERAVVTVQGVNIYPSPFGKGVIRTGELIRRLRETGYEGYLSIEHFDAGDQLAYMCESAAWILAEWGKAGA